MNFDYSELFALCQDRLYYYSSYRFIKGHDPQSLIEQTVTNPIMDKINRGAISAKEISVGNEPHYVLVEPLTWDTEYFGLPVYKIATVLYAHKNYSLLKDALQRWVSGVSGEQKANYFINIPAEDTYLIQALCECGFRLTETRLQYFKSDVSSYCSERYPVRKACESDIENLRKVALQMRNPYDRLHADASFNEERADAYLATYIENAVRGFVDMVLVPAEGDGPPDGFFTVSFPETILGRKITRLGNAAVLRETRKGWYRKLISEAFHVLKENGTDYVMGDTQATNRAVQLLLAPISKLAFVTHVLSKSIS